jgi:hypothetical protein
MDALVIGTSLWSSTTSVAAGSRSPFSELRGNDRNAGMIGPISHPAHQELEFTGCATDLKLPHGDATPARDAGN